MHQVASSIAGYFLSPINWIIVLIIAGFFLRNQLLKKIFRITALCIFVLFGNTWLLDQYAKNWQPLPKKIEPGSEYSCGIIAGGFASPDAYGNGYFNAASDRFIQAVKLYKMGIIKQILISGGNGKKTKKNFREGEWVKEELIIMGIPGPDIIAEDQSGNTADNARYSKHILDSLHLRPPYLLITSAHHQPRALLLFRNEGIPVVPFPCNYIAGRDGSPGLLSIVPRVSTLLGWDVYLRETAGYFWYYLRKPKSE